MEFPIYLLNRIKPMPAPLEQSLRYYLECKTIPKGEIICREGEICKYIYFIRKGRVRYFNYGKGGREVFRGFRNAGDLIFPEDHGPSHCNMQATEDCEYWCILLEDYLGVYEQFPEFKEYGLFLEERCQLLEEQDFLARII